MKVAAVQHDIAWEDRDTNLDRLRPLVASAADRGAELVLLSEMFATGFSMNTQATAEPFGGPTSEFLVQQAAKHQIWLAGSVAEMPAEGSGRPSNCLVLAGPDCTVHRYRKIHPFSYGQEDKHYAAGHAVLTIDVCGIRVTPFICYDLRFSDIFWAAAPQTDLYVVVANWPSARQNHWTTLLRARAIENEAYVCGVNRVGTGGGLEFAGGSILIDPFGATLAEAGDEQQILVGDVEPDRVAEVRHMYPFLADRRP